MRIYVQAGIGSGWGYTVNIATISDERRYIMDIMRSKRSYQGLLDCPVNSTIYNVVNVDL